MIFPPDVQVNPQRHLWVPRTRDIHFIETHATRGPTTPNLQFQATVNWMQSPGNNNGGWGGSCSYIIGRDGRLGWVLEDDQQPTYSAGYGGAGSEWSIDEYGISYEWCQSPAQEEFTTEQYERGAIEYADTCLNYGIPVITLDIQSQRGPVPKGIVRHDRCENGRKLGKTDPGPRFRDSDFEALIREKINELIGEDDLKIEDIDARITSLLAGAHNLNARFVRASGQDEVYEIINGRRVWLVTPDVAFARGVARDLSNVTVINGVQLLAWPEGQL